MLACSLPSPLTWRGSSFMVREVQGAASNVTVTSEPSRPWSVTWRSVNRPCPQMVDVLTTVWVVSVLDAALNVFSNEGLMQIASDRHRGARSLSGAQHDRSRRHERDEQIPSEDGLRHAQPQSGIPLHVRARRVVGHPITGAKERWPLKTTRFNHLNGKRGVNRRGVRMTLEGCHSSSVVELGELLAWVASALQRCAIW